MCARARARVCVCACVCSVLGHGHGGSHSVCNHTSRALAACAARLLTKSMPIAKVVLCTRFSNLEAWSIQCLGAAMLLASKFAMHPQTAVRCSSQQSATSAAAQSLQPGLCKWDGTLQLHVPSNSSSRQSSVSCNCSFSHLRSRAATAAFCIDVPGSCRASAHTTHRHTMQRICLPKLVRSSALTTCIAARVGVCVCVCVCVRVLGGSQPVCKHTSDAQVCKVTAWLGDCLAVPNGARIYWNRPQYPCTKEIADARCDALLAMIEATGHPFVVHACPVYCTARRSEVPGSRKFRLCDTTRIPCSMQLLSAHAELLHVDTVRRLFTFCSVSHHPRADCSPKCLLSM